MADHVIEANDLIATLEAQRNEAQNAAARAGAAAASALRRIEALEKELADAKTSLAAATKTTDKPGDYEAQAVTDTA